MAIRLNWNPQRAPRDVSRASIEDLERDGIAYIRWRCGSTKVEVDERVFLVRTGRDQRGVVGMGRTVSERGGGFDDEDGVWIPHFVDVGFEMLSLEPIVPREALDAPPLDTVAWSNATAAARLQPHQADHLERLMLDARPLPGRPSFEIIEVEAAHTETGEIAGRGTGVFERRESSLVQRFIVAMRAQGSPLKAIRFNPVEWPGALRCDLYDPVEKLIIEAKSDCDRNTIRLAIGQLADYARLHGEPCRKVLLLPREPHRDFMDLLRSQGVAVVWESGETFAGIRESVT